MSDKIVWLPEYNRYAILVHRAHYSVLSWVEDNQRFEVEIANDEYEEINGDDDDD